MKHGLREGENKLHFVYSYVKVALHVQIRLANLVGGHLRINLLDEQVCRIPKSQLHEWQLDSVAGKMLPRSQRQVAAHGSCSHTNPWTSQEAASATLHWSKRTGC